ncbi:MAG: CDP-diacylglycerol--glycerol-3-phosphate 3-phosphatidyltransferase [Candidatus Moanabacter tarae]|uniref:CDP-diacylglycerol--glycerol-3-phosphate 3-phosphatidyltransferase n=1 Tax=Candidatus Moanibacter tarae TaxID=2200854 RepID=A0A2Z4AEA0_9BACT|nr:MAG: CDP-diacylglycerol--glycerol-3-phosphate 3-phosphatidyltransferase [Candidatus Moanabacter tarae]|tara:strand:+ start:10419 stop:11033 length:615 start_codon:yes stop_codon:yes gene_type:complete
MTPGLLVNLPNLITLSRIPLLFVISALLYAEWIGAPSIAFFLFVFAGVTDWIDGYIARKFNMISNFGKLMDALADKIIIVGMFVTLLAVQMLPKWSIGFVLLILCREFLVTGLRLVAAGNGVVLAAEKRGKQKTIMQIICISVILAVPSIREDFSYLTGFSVGWFADLLQELGIAFFVLVSLFTIYSGLVYLKKYWTVVFELPD